MIALFTPFAYSPIYRDYFEFFFTKLKLEQDKLFFLEHFTDEDLTQSLKYTMKYFDCYEYNDANFIKLAEGFDLQRRDLLKWHRCYLLDMTNEYWINGDDILYKGVLQNPTFKYLITLKNEEALTELYMNLSSIPPDGVKLTEDQVKQYAQKREIYHRYVKENRGNK